MPGSRRQSVRLDGRESKWGRGHREREHSRLSPAHQQRIQLPPTTNLLEEQTQRERMVSPARGPPRHMSSCLSGAPAVGMGPFSFRSADVSLLTSQLRLTVQTGCPKVQNPLPRGSDCEIQDKHSVTESGNCLVVKDVSGR